MNMNFVEACKVVRVSNAVAASQTALNTAIVDMGEPAAVGGFDAVAFLVAFGTNASGTVVTATVQDNSLNQAGGMANVTSANAVITQTDATKATITQSSTNCGVVFTDVSAGSVNKLLLIDCTMPMLRFVRLAITIATANAAFDGIFAILYRLKQRPMAVDASLSGTALFVANS